MERLDRTFRIVVPAICVPVLATILAVGWFTEPDRLATGYAPEQPIHFSHQLHAGTLKISCLYCHSGAARARIAGIPAIETCMGCHGVTKTGNGEIQKLTRIFQSGGSLAWNRVYTLPDYVFFDHRPHVHAGIACQTCHGEVQTMGVLKRAMSLRMANCLACHRNPRPALPGDSLITRAAENCAACHR